MTVSEIDDRRNENRDGGPEYKNACHEFDEGHKAFNYSGNAFPEKYNDIKDGLDEVGGNPKDFHEGHNERKDARHGFKDAYPECKDGNLQNHDGHNGFQNPK